MSVPSNVASLGENRDMPESVRDVRSSIVDGTQTTTTATMKQTELNTDNTNHQNKNPNQNPNPNTRSPEVMRARSDAKPPIVRRSSSVRGRPRARMDRTWSTRTLSRRGSHTLRGGMFTYLGRRIQKFKQGDFELALSDELEDHIVYKDMPYYILEDYYHTVIDSPWTVLLTSTIFIMLVFVILFGLLLWAADEEEDKSWWDAYNLSLQSWTTIGYGVLYPENNASEAIVAVMTFVSFVFVALCTGIALIKFALPYAPLAWANIGVIRNVNKKPCLQIRLAMLTGKDQLVDCKFQCFAITPRTSKEGYMMLSSTELRFQNATPLALGPTYTLSHEIQPHSAIGRLLRRAVSAGEMNEESDFVIVVRLIAYSMRFQSDVASSKFYHASDLLVGHRFVDILSVQESQASVDQGRPPRRFQVDLGQLSKTVPSLFDGEELVLKSNLSIPESLPLPEFKPPSRMSSLRPSSRPVSRAPSVPQRTSVASIRNSTPDRIARYSLENSFLPPEHVDRLSREEKTGKRGFFLKKQGKKFHITEVELEEETALQHITHGFTKIHWSEASDRNCKRRRVEIKTVGQPWWFKAQPTFWYSKLVNASWINMLLVLFVFYFAAITIFAGLMFIDKDSLLEESRQEYGEGFEVYLWWSHHTLSTVGYGHLTPGNAYGNFLITLEGLLGLVLLAMLSGVTYAKFSGIQARVLWSDYAVINMFDGKPHLMIRCASLWKGHLILTARVRISALVRSKGIDDEQQAYQVQLKLVRQSNTVFAFTGTWMHEIDHKSPLLGLLPKHFREMNELDFTAENAPDQVLRLICVLEGFDGLFQQTVISSFNYEVLEKGFNLDDLEAGSVQVGYKFEDVLMQDKLSRKVVIDYSRFHNIIADRKSGLYTAGGRGSVITERSPMLHKDDKGIFSRMWQQQDSGNGQQQEHKVDDIDIKLDHAESGITHSDSRFTHKSKPNGSNDKEPEKIEIEMTRRRIPKVKSSSPRSLRASTAPLRGSTVPLRSSTPPPRRPGSRRSGNPLFSKKHRHQRSQSEDIRYGEFGYRH